MNGVLSIGTDYLPFTIREQVESMECRWMNFCPT